MSRAERAKDLFKQGYACSQAVALAFCDLTKVCKEEMIRLTLPFGGGLGRLRLTCGAVSGMAVIVGLIFADSENSPENKIQTYAITRELCERFQNENGSLNPKSLKNPFLFQLKNGSFGVLAIRTGGDGEDDEHNIADNDVGQLVQSVHHGAVRIDNFHGQIPFLGEKKERRGRGAPG